MAVATKPSVCLGCGETVAAGAGFCPVCGTRLAPDRPMPLRVGAADTERAARAANGWLLAALVIAALVLAVAGLIGAWIGTHVAEVEPGGAAGEGDAAAAESMEDYAPLAEGWAGKHDHVVDEASGDDPNGLAAAAADAGTWIDVNREAVAGVAAGSSGGSRSMYHELVGIFDERRGVLAEIEAIATAGGTGPGAAAGEVAELAALEQRADAVTCEIADVMRAEGDDPAAHLPPEAGIAC